MNERDLIIFVCTANICRSPLAEGLFKEAIKDDSFFQQKNLKTISAGVYAMQGEIPSLNSVLALSDLGINLGEKTSILLNQELVSRAVAIFGMTSSHIEDIKYKFDDLPKILMTMTDASKDCDKNSIVDPYGASLDFYKQTRDTMSRIVPDIIELIKNRVS